MSGFGVQAQGPTQQQTAGTGGPPQPPAPTPLTPEEKAYLAACGEAILAGSAAAKNAASSSLSEDFLRYSEGVNQLAMALNAIKGKVKGGPGH